MPLIEYVAVINTAPDAVWQQISQGGVTHQWHPAIGLGLGAVAPAPANGTGVLINTVNGVRHETLRERLLSVNNTLMTLVYGLEKSAWPVANFVGTVHVSPAISGASSVVAWTATFTTQDQCIDEQYEALITGLIKNGHESLARYLSPQLGLTIR